MSQGDWGPSENILQQMCWLKSFGKANMFKQLVPLPTRADTAFRQRCLRRRCLLPPATAGAVRAAGDVVATTAAAAFAAAGAAVPALLLMLPIFACASVLNTEAGPQQFESKDPSSALKESNNEHGGWRYYYIPMMVYYLCAITVVIYTQ